jgi:hypothetical protein
MMQIISDRTMRKKIPTVLNERSDNDMAQISHSKLLNRKIFDSNLSSQKSGIHVG